MSNEVYDKLDDVFNTEFENDGGNISSTIEKYEEAKNDLVKKTQNKMVDDFTMEDKEYISFELKSLISNGIYVLEKLNEEIKTGVKPSYYDAYFNGVNSLREIMKELRELNKAVVDATATKYKMEGKSKEAGNLTVNNFNLTGKQLLMKLNDAQKQSSLKEIKAEFQINKDKL
jgi:hypothetical protein